MNMYPKKVYLPIIIIIYSILELVVGLLPSPQIIYPAGFVLGIFTYYFVYRIMEESILLLDISLFGIPIIGSFLGSVFLWVTCGYLSQTICLPSKLKAQIFANFTFPLLIVFFLWITQRFPKIHGKK